MIGKDIAAVWEKDRGPYGRPRTTSAQIDAALARAREAALLSEATREMREDAAVMVRLARQANTVPRVRG